MFCFHSVFATTLVYNLRVRRSFDSSLVFTTKRKSIWGVSVVPIVRHRSIHVQDAPLQINLCENRTAGGALLNARYIYGPCWFEATTAVIHESAHSRGTTVFDESRTGLDDIVLSFGRDCCPTAETHLVLYGVAGFPTKRDVETFELQDTLVGTRFFAAGGGCELSHSFIRELKRALIVLFQGRFLHFFTRDWSPPLPPGSKIQPGNVSDLLYAVRYRIKKNIIETGYNQTFFTDQAVILPTTRICADFELRHSVYASYSYFFRNVLVVHRPMLIGIGVSLSRSKRFDLKDHTVWLNITTAF